MKKDIDIEEFNELVEQIKTENPTIDIEFCKYIAGSYLLYDKSGIEKPADEVDEFNKTNEVIIELTTSCEA